MQTKNMNVIGSRPPPHEPCQMISSVLQALHMNALHMNALYMNVRCKF